MATTHFRRIRLLLATCFALGLVVPIVTADPVAATYGPAPLELGAMAVMPDDLANLGRPGYRIERGYAEAIGEVARVMGSDSGTSAEEARDLLEHAGFGRAQALILGRPTGTSGRTVVVTVYEFAEDGRSITQGFKVIKKTPAGGTVVRVTRSFGDESTLARLTFDDPRVGSRTRVSISAPASTGWGPA